MNFAAATASQHCVHAFPQVFVALVVLVVHQPDDAGRLSGAVVLFVWVGKKGLYNTVYLLGSVKLLPDKTHLNCCALMEETSTSPGWEWISGGGVACGGRAGSGRRAWLSCGHGSSFGDRVVAACGSQCCFAVMSSAVILDRSPMFVQLCLAACVTQPHPLRKTHARMQSTAFASHSPPAGNLGKSQKNHMYS